MAAVSPRPTILPSRGVARVKNVVSGDTLILLGKPATPNGKAPEVIFTLENISAPRYDRSRFLSFPTSEGYLV